MTEPADVSIRPWSLRKRLRGPWRVAIVEGSMLPSIAPGDWLLVDPTGRGWPRIGSVVVFREPETDELSVKRVAALPGDRVRFAGGYLVIGADEAWLLADATAGIAGEAGFGPPIDSNRFGPVPRTQLVGRVMFRYGPLGRIGRISSADGPDARS